MTIQQLQQSERERVAQDERAKQWRTELPDRPGLWEFRKKDEYMHKECGWPLFRVVTLHVFHPPGCGLNAFNGLDTWMIEKYEGGEFRYVGQLQPRSQRPPRRDENTPIKDTTL